MAISEYWNFIRVCDSLKSVYQISSFYDSPISSKTVKVLWFLATNAGYQINMLVGIDFNIYRKIAADVNFTNQMKSNTMYFRNALNPLWNANEK